MASFSTLPTGWLPWTANTLTVAVMAIATWWSADQRPNGAEHHRMTLVAQSPASAQASSKKQATQGAGTATRVVRASTTEPALQRLPAEGLLPVSYQAPATTAR